MLNSDDDIRDIREGFGELSISNRQQLRQATSCLDADEEYMEKRDMPLSTFFLACGLPVGSRGN